MGDRLFDEKKTRNRYDLKMMHFVLTKDQTEIELILNAERFQRTAIVILRGDDNCGEIFISTTMYIADFEI